MSALTPTYPLGSRGKATEFGGTNRLFIFTVVPLAATDTITLVRASDFLSTIVSIVAQITAGTTANFATVEPTFSGLVITLKSYNASGVAATVWTSASVDLWVVGS